MDDLPSEGAAQPEASADSGGQGAESLEDVRRLITQRMQRMASAALDVYEHVMKAPSRNATAQLAAARDVLELLTEGKLQAPVQVRPTQPTSSVELAKLSEQIRLVKQDERRRA